MQLYPGLVIADCYYFGNIIVVVVRYINRCSQIYQ